MYFNLAITILFFVLHFVQKRLIHIVLRIYVVNEKCYLELHFQITSSTIEAVIKKCYLGSINTH